MANQVIVGVDVGGTNTDAVVLRNRDILASSKCITTTDVTTGVKRAITLALNHANAEKGSVFVSRIHIGTTHFVNALVQRKGLVKVAAIRLCGQASLALPPYSNFPADLKQVVFGGVYTVNGGFEFDGKKEISTISESQLKEVADELKSNGIKQVVISGIFSPVNDIHEIRAAEILKNHLPDLSITLSSSIGTLGVLERENAAILNESLRPLADKTLKAFRQALDELGLTCPFYFSQNDGTLLSAEQALELPVNTFASGVTNSMRGATFLSGRRDAVVVDIGGTSCDVGVIVKGFPREAGIHAQVGGVSTNFRMPDVVSIGLGGGSVVRVSDDSVCKIGPDSVGYRLPCEAIVFGGDTLTTTDIAVASGLASGIGDASKVAHLGQDLLKGAQNTIHSMLETAIDQVRVSSEEVVAVLVGGGSVLIDPSIKLAGISEIILPPSSAVANAVGAALSQVAGCVDQVVRLDETTREQAILDATKTAAECACAAGADPDTIETVDVMEVALAYLPGHVTRVKVKVVGELKVAGNVQAVLWRSKSADEANKQEGVLQMSSSTGSRLSKETVGVEDYLADALTETKPYIDPSTGEWHLSGWDVECISVGAGILGCGGGGSPEIGRLRAHLALSEGKTIRVIHPDRLVKKMQAEDRVAPLAYMGAPTILMERLWSEQEYADSLQAMIDLYNLEDYDEKEGVLDEKDWSDIHHSDQISYIDDYQSTTPSGQSTTKIKVVALFCDEIGGSNCFTPLLLGAHTDLPIVDADSMGRAFPELQMCVTLINGVKPFPATLADHSGRKAVVLRVNSAKALEDHFRDVVCQMGCAAALMTRLLTREELAQKVVKYSISRAWRLGRVVVHARKNNASPIQAIIEHEGAHNLASGKINAIKRRTVGGFARGELTLEGLGDFVSKTYKVDFQNENLVASEILANGDTKVLACTPDLLTLVSSDSGQPIATEEVRYGLRVSLILIPAPPELTTPQALKVVGPHAFGYLPEQVEYIPAGIPVQHQPIPPQD